MRTTLIIATLACYLIPCDAQEFSFSMYFKDAAGNKDTLVFGYDGNATHGLDPQFGETDYYGQQMNSELCVFAADSWYSSYRDTFLLYNKN